MTWLLYWQNACHYRPALRRARDLERAVDYSSSVPHVLQSHSFRSTALPEADAIVSDGKCNFAARCGMHLNRNLVSLRVSNGVADRLLRNPVNVQGYG